MLFIMVVTKHKMKGLLPDYRQSYYAKSIKGGQLADIILNTLRFPNMIA